MKEFKIKKSLPLPLPRGLGEFFYLCFSPALVCYWRFFKPPKMKKVIAVFLAGAAVLLTGCTQMSEDAAKERALSFINTVLMAPGTSADIKEVVAENGMFKITVDAAGKEIISYMSGDGAIFFPSVMEIDKMMAEKEAASATEQAPVAEVSKSEKPVVDLFVMSHCPFGTQMEKGMLPVVEQLGNTIDFNLKFVNYAMHGEKEVKEQLNQYCIGKEQNEKLLPYLTCFLGTDGGDTAGETCLVETEINRDSLASCTAATDEEFNIIANLEDKEGWLNGRFPKFMIDDVENQEFGVQGSPSLVINGAKVNSGRDAASILNLVCSSFETQPEECTAELSAEAPAPGFGWEGSGANTDASCG